MTADAEQLELVVVELSHGERRIVYLAVQRLRSELAFDVELSDHVRDVYGNDARAELNSVRDKLKAALGRVPE